MKIIIICLAAIAVIGGIFSLSTLSRTSNNQSTSATSPKPQLTLRAQVATSTVRVDSVTLPQPGFLAVRSIDGARLGQIIEISRYLTPGTQENIDIPLGDFYEGDKELIVMAYEDVGNDKIFNDLDQPLEIDGIPLSVYVASGSPVPGTITKNTKNANAIHTMGTTTMATVRYTDTGYEPKELSVPIGTMVTFVNERKKDMWVASDPHPAHTDLPTFDQFGYGKPGEQYLYTFDTVGTWAYHDHLNPEKEGVIIVK